jgi:hypothetical protein
MALLKVSEFAEQYGIERENVYTYRNRKRLIIIDGYLDEDNPINRLWIEQRKGLLEVKRGRPKSTVKKEPIPKPKKEHKTVIPKKEVTSYEYTEDTERTRMVIGRSKDNLSSVILYEQELKTQKLEEDLRLSRLKTDKIEGKLVPINLVKTSTGEIIVRYKTTFLQQTEQLIRDILNELQAPNEKITGVCSRLVDIANESSKRAVSETKIAIKNIIEESVNTK